EEAEVAAGRLHGRHQHRLEPERLGEAARRLLGAARGGHGQGEGELDAPVVLAVAVGADVLGAAGLFGVGGAHERNVTSTGPPRGCRRRTRSCSGCSGAGCSRTPTRATARWSTAAPRSASCWPTATCSSWATPSCSTATR